MQHKEGLLKAIKFFGSQSILAKKIHVTQQSISQWLNREYRIPYDKAVRIFYVTQGNIPLDALAPDESEINALFKTSPLPRRKKSIKLNHTTGGDLVNRIRTVKPELFRHEMLFDAEKLHQLPLRLAFVGLFTCCDREGRFRWRPKLLKLDIFPYDTVDMEKILDALCQEKFINKYEVSSEYYGCIPSWHRHQVVNHRESESILPAPESGKLIYINEIEHGDSVTNLPDHHSIEKEVIDACCTDEARVPHESRSCLGMPGGKGKGKGKGNGKGIEMEQEGVLVAPARPCSSRESQIHQVFSHWQSSLKHPNAVLDSKRHRLINQALQSGYSVSQLCEAIDGCAKTPHNLGDNDRGQRYDGLHVIFRDADQIERFIQNSYTPPQSRIASQRWLQSNLTVGQNWLQRHESELQEDADATH